VCLVYDVYKEIHVRLQIHDIPDELMRALKRRAIDEGKTLKDWVVTALTELVGRPEVKRVAPDPSLNVVPPVKPNWDAINLSIRKGSK
jgi:hypothetical protein